jgi:hypothetical protein
VRGALHALDWRGALMLRGAELCAAAPPPPGGGGGKGEAGERAARFLGLVAVEARHVTRCEAAR